MKTKTKLAAALMLALAGAFAAVAQQQSLTGVVTDSMCGATHMAKDKTPAECTQLCVKDGMKYALAVEKKVYTLEGHEAELAKLAGQTTRCPFRKSPRRNNQQFPLDPGIRSSV